MKRKLLGLIWIPVVPLLFLASCYVDICTTDCGHVFLAPGTFLLRCENAHQNCLFDLITTGKADVDGIISPYPDRVTLIPSDIDVDITLSRGEIILTYSTSCSAVEGKLIVNIFADGNWQESKDFDITGANRYKIEKRAKYTYRSSVRSYTWSYSTQGSKER